MFYFWIILSVALILVGFLGAALPFLPGLPLAFLGTYILAAITGFHLISKPVLYVLGGLTLISLLVDHLSGLLGNRLGRASLWGTLGAIGGLVIGFLAFGFLGLLLGPAIGALIFELVGRRGHRNAIRVAQKTLLGSLFGLVSSLILTILFLIILVLALII